MSKASGELGVGGGLLEWRHLTVTKILCVLIIFFIISHTHSKLEPWFHFSEAHFPERTAGDTCLSRSQWEYETLHPLTKGWALHACPQGSLRCLKRRSWKLWEGKSSWKESLREAHLWKCLFPGLFLVYPCVSCLREVEKPLPQAPATVLPHPEVWSDSCKS